MTDDQWAEWEASYDPEAEEQARLALIRIRGYALASCSAAAHAREQLEKAVDAMVRARKRAQRMLKRAHRACDRAELASRFASRCMVGDTPAKTQAEVALLLEEIFG